VARKIVSVYCVLRPGCLAQVDHRCATTEKQACCYLQIFAADVPLQHTPAYAISEARAFRSLIPSISKIVLSHTHEMH
jgi:hypothetical protein